MTSAGEVQRGCYTPKHPLARQHRLHWMHRPLRDNDSSEAQAHAPLIQEWCIDACHPLPKFVGARRGCCRVTCKRACRRPQVQLGSSNKLGRAAPHASLCSSQQAGDAKGACASMGRLRLTYWRHSFRRAHSIHRRVIE